VDLFNELKIIFDSTVGAITLIALTLGIIITITEVLIPGFGVMGFTGIGVSIAAIIYRIIKGLTLNQALILFIVYFVILLILYGLLVLSFSKGLLSRSQLFSDKPSIPYDFEKSNNNKMLLGKVGVTSTICKPVGKAVFDGKEYEVISENTYLDKDTDIKVIKVTGDEVVVSKI